MSSFGRRSIRDAITPCTVGGNFQRIPGSLRGKPASITLEYPPVDELPRDLFDEKRNLAGMPKHVGLESVEFGRRPEQAVEQRFR